MFGSDKVVREQIRQQEARRAREQQQASLERQQALLERRREGLARMGIDKLDTVPIVSIPHCRYIGGVPGLQPTRVAKSKLHVSTNCMGMGNGNIDTPWIALPGIAGVAVSGRQVARNRFMAEAFLGVEGLGARGTAEQTIVSVRLKESGTTVYFQIDSRSAGLPAQRIRAAIETPLARAEVKVYDTLDHIPAPHEPTRPPSEDMADQLAKLAKLHADGVLDDDEFKAAKARLLQ